MERTRSLLGGGLVSGVGSPADVWREGTVVVVMLRGEQDLSTAAGVARVLAEVGAASGGDVVVDLSQVRFMDASTVGVLMDGREALRVRFRALRLREPSRFARRVLALCGVDLVDPVARVVCP